MPNIQKVTGRHKWKETVLKRGYEKVPHSLICMNCRAYRYADEGDPPVTGCLSDVDLTRAGSARLNDHMEQEMRRRKSQDDADLAEAAQFGLDPQRLVEELTQGG